MEAIGDSLSNKSTYSSIANSASKVRKPSIEEVDALADEIAGTFATVAYRPWYCQLCYKLGVSRVRELFHRSRHGKQAAHLFSYLARAEERKADAREKRSHE